MGLAAANGKVFVFGGDATTFVDCACRPRSGKPTPQGVLHGRRVFQGPGSCPWHTPCVCVCVRAACFEWTLHPSCLAVAVFFLFFFCLSLIAVWRRVRSVGVLRDKRPLRVRPELSDVERAAQLSPRHPAAPHWQRHGCARGACVRVQRVARQR
eukprot:2813101-Rhodomonas_salina.2